MQGEGRRVTAYASYEGRPDSAAGPGFLRYRCAASAHRALLSQGRGQKYSPDADVIIKD